MPNILRIIVFVTVLLNAAKACQCPLSELSKKECSKYELIFRGKVTSIAKCDDKPGVAIFEINDLYKGNASKYFKVLYKCDDPCNVGFNVGEEWIIYTRFFQVNNAMMDWCSRSRKFIKNEKEDFYAVTYGNSYDDEIKFLQDSLGIHRLMKEQMSAAEHRNLLPTPNQSIIILICSLVTIVLFFYFFNKYFK